MQTDLLVYYEFCCTGVTKSDFLISVKHAQLCYVRKREIYR